MILSLKPSMRDYGIQTWHTGDIPMDAMARMKLKARKKKTGAD